MSNTRSGSGAKATSSRAPRAARRAVEPVEPVVERPERGHYLAIAAIGEGDQRVRAGQEFDAYPDDVRVLSGWVVKLKVRDETPANVAAAFDAAEGR